MEKDHPANEDSIPAVTSGAIGKGIYPKLLRHLSKAPLHIKVKDAITHRREYVGCKSSHHRPVSKQVDISQCDTRSTVTFPYKQCSHCPLDETAESRRLSWPGWLVTYQDSILANDNPI